MALAHKILFTNKTSPIYKEVHISGCISDYTLCGLTMDGDTDTAGDYIPTTKKITCRQCKRIVLYCHNIDKKEVA